jgi:hypothetical protein
MKSKYELITEMDYFDVVAKKKVYIYLLHLLQKHRELFAQSIWIQYNSIITCI